jgi:hypothetical protein
MRVSSVSGKRGLRATSAITATASAADSENTSVPRVVWFGPTLTSSAPPIMAICCAICSADRVAVPCSIIEPVTSASHVSVTCSSTFPVWVTSRIVAFGTSP